MRLSVSLFVLAAMFLTSCANEGVIVRKDSRPFPFYASVGIEGMYTFLLRDNAGTVRRQMVTPEIYEQYAIGEYFNDLQPGPLAHGDRSDAKTMKAAAFSAAKPNRLVATNTPDRSNVRHAAKASALTRTRTAAKTAGSVHQRAHAKTIASQTRRSKKTSGSKTATAHRKKKTHHIASANHSKRKRKHSDSDIVFINGEPGLR